MYRAFFGDFKEAGALLRAQIAGQGNNSSDPVVFALAFDLDFLVA